MVKDVLAAVREELKLSADEKTKNSSARYFKEPVAFYGVKTSLVNKIAVKYYQEVKPLGKKAIWAFCEELLKSDYSEEAFIACKWSYRLHHEYEPGDFAVFERWLNLYVNNWAKCDTLCNHTIGTLVTQFPQFTGKLKEWTKSGNRWLRRAAAVTLIVPAKQGLFLPEILEIANSLLTDRDDMVQKGYGWLLKDASIKHPQEIFQFVMQNKQAMPRTALRYAIERFPAEMKQQAMAKA